MTVDPQHAALLQRIAAEFPELHWDSYRYIGEGWDHHVIILDDKLVFRFPDDEEYRQKLSFEIEVLSRLRPAVTANIPDYSYIAADKSFAGYDIVPGKNLSKDYFDTLPAAEQTEIARQVAAFLSALHTQDVSQGLLSTVSQSYMPADHADVKRVSAGPLKDVLSPADYALVQQINSEVDELITRQLPKAPKVFIHNDMYSRHLFWETAQDSFGRLGVIDFSDMSLDDPAIDFGELHEYGVGFVQQVYKMYAELKNEPQDADFLERAWTYQRWAAVYMLVDYFEVQKTSFAVARETFDRVKRGR